MTKDEKYIYESIVHEVRMGFYSEEEVREIIIEQVENEDFEDEIPSSWVNTQINAAFKKLETESKTWVHPTDTERLAKAFNELCVMKIIALHFAGFTTDDGEGEVVEIELELNKQGIESDGYCFYHEQDLVRAIDTKSLLIAYQKVDNSDPEVTIKVGSLVVQKLKDNGFDVIWDGTGNEKIEIPNFNWQKIYTGLDDHLFMNGRALDMMTK